MVQAIAETFTGPERFEVEIDRIAAALSAAKEFPRLTVRSMRVLTHRTGLYGTSLNAFTKSLTDCTLL